MANSQLWRVKRSSNYSFSRDKLMHKELNNWQFKSIRILLLKLVQIDRKLINNLKKLSLQLFLSKSQPPLGLPKFQQPDLNQ